MKVLIIVDNGGGMVYPETNKHAMVKHRRFVLAKREWPVEEYPATRVDGDSEVSYY